MKFRNILICLICAASLLNATGQESSDDLYQQAYEEFLKRDYQKASAVLDQIVPDDQQKPDILNLRGAIYKRLGELDNAANAFGDALKIAPKDWVPKYNLADIQFLRGDYKAARNYLQESLTTMPEVDRGLKQDLILYKVYLTFLLEDDKEKARLLLDSFDMNSPNPVYYFAQAAWSFKNNEADKAKTLIESTDGLYSEELRNVYSQALVDVGWMPASAALAGTPAQATATATATASVTATPAVSAAPSPTAVAAESPVASPTALAATTPDDSGMVPLASANATPLLGAPLETPTPAASVAPTPLEMGINAQPEPQASSKKSSPLGMILFGLLVIATAGVALLLLARRGAPSGADRELTSFQHSTSRQASSTGSSPDETPEAASLHALAEGTGEVKSQEPVVESAPASIQIRPREKALDPRAGEPASESATKPVSPTARLVTRRIPLAAQTGGKAKPVAKATPKATPKTGSKTPVKPAATKPVATKPSLGGRKVAPAKPATPEPVQTPVKTVAKPAAPSASKPATAKPAAKAKPAQPAAKPAAITPAKPAGEPVVKSQAPAPKASVKLAAKPAVKPGAKATTTPVAKQAVKPAAKSSARPAVKAPAKSTAKPAAKPTAKIPVTAETEKASAPVRPVSPVITIPEFEDEILQPKKTTVLRLVPNPDAGSADSQPSGEAPKS